MPWRRTSLLLFLSSIAGCFDFTAVGNRGDGWTLEGPAPDEVSIPGGAAFTLGLRGDTQTVAPFYIDRTELTVASYQACVAHQGCDPAPTTVMWLDIAPGDVTGWSATCNGDRADHQQHPINCVDWSEATAYCHAQGKRLPTEAEWEWVARGRAAASSFPWGNVNPSATDDPPRLCWGNDETVGTCEAARFSPRGDSPDGVEDLAGNVAEWVSDCFDQPYDCPASSTDDRVAKNGSWSDDTAATMQAGSRQSQDPTSRYSVIGFRCARSP